MSSIENKNTSINKLFLIGNGLDLALGLKTSYTDFMFWLLKKQLLEAAENFGRQEAPKPYRGRFIKVYGEYEPLTIFGYSSNELFDILFKEGYGEIPDKIKSADNLKDLLKTINLYKITIQPKFENLLFNSIYNQCELGWVDIEETYFQFIKIIIDHKKSSEIKEKIQFLNNELEYISKELKKYLSEIKTNVDIISAKKYGDQFLDEIKSTDVISNELNSKKFELEKIYFLNFNYTYSLCNICEKDVRLSEKKIINHIHGHINGIDPIIFGYGDEMDKYYKTIEELRDNEFFKHIKSFQYFKNNRYRDLLRFLNSNAFQVCVYGHSCDISDRVMLNEIFEHENCVSVKVYFYKDENGKTDFTNKTMNISRHFNSNKLMREKIVEFNPDNEIPQIK